MSDPIFRDQSEPEERPTDYIANPVRVQLPKYDARAEGRRWTQMDLVALANNILAREEECAVLRKEVRALTIRLSGVNTRLDAIEATVTSVVRQSSTGNKIGRIFDAIEKILNEDDDDSDDDSDDDEY